MFLDALVEMAEKPAGLAVMAAIIIMTMSTSFVLFPPSNKEEDDPTLRDKYLTYTYYQPQATWMSDMKVLKAMWFSKITGEDLQERLELRLDEGDPLVVQIARPTAGWRNELLFGRQIGNSGQNRR